MLAACQVPYRVEDAYVVLPAIPGRPAVAYFRVEGGASEGAATLIGVRGPFRRAELHETMGSAGPHGMTMSAMRPLKGVPLTYDAPVEFAPGGKHVMLFGLDPGLKPGQTVRFDLLAASGDKPPVPVELARGKAVVVAAGSPSPHRERLFGLL